MFFLINNFKNRIRVKQIEKIGLWNRILGTWLPLKSCTGYTIPLPHRLPCCHQSATPNAACMQLWPDSWTGSTISKIVDPVHESPPILPLLAPSLLTPFSFLFRRPSLHLSPIFSLFARNLFTLHSLIILHVFCCPLSVVCRHCRYHIGMYIDIDFPTISSLFLC